MRTINLYIMACKPTDVLTHCSRRRTFIMNTFKEITETRFWREMNPVFSIDAAALAKKPANISKYTGACFVKN